MISLVVGGKVEQYQFIALKGLELFTILFGLFCVGLSLILAFRFHRIKAPLSKALFFQLFAEAVVGFVTVLFAVTSWFDMYAHLSPKIVLGMRLVIFSAASLTSINLYKTVKNIENEKSSEKQE